MGKVNLVRPDGSLIQVDREQAAPLLALGYREESTGNALARNDAIAQENYYSSTGQKVKTFGEGVAAGVTLGLSDIAFDAAGFDTAERANYNPGTRLGGEITGSLLPILPGAGAKLALTPAGLLTRGAAGAGQRFAGNRIKQFAVQGAIEGAGVGAQQAISESVINADPLTVESVAAGIGWGAMFGGGLGALTGKAASAIEGRAAGKAAKEAEATLMADSYAAFRSSLDDINGEIDKAFKSAEQAVDAAKLEAKAAGVRFKSQKADVAARNAAGKAEVEVENMLGKAAVRDENKAMRAVTDLSNEQAMGGAVERAQAVLDQATDIRNNFFNELTLKGVEKSNAAIKLHKKEGIRAFNEMKQALKSKNFAALEKAQARFNEHVAAINDDLVKMAEGDMVYQMRLEAFPDQAIAPAKLPPAYKAEEVATEAFSPRQFTPREFTPEPPPVFLPLEQLTLASAQESFKSLKQMSATRMALAGFPRTLEDFSRMTPARAEKLFGAVDNFMKVDAAEMAGIKEGLKNAIAKMQESLGLTIEGTPATQLRGIYEANRLIPTRKVQEEVSRGGLPWLVESTRRSATYVGGRMGSRMASKFGPFVRTVAYETGRRVTGALLGIKGAVVGGVTKAARDWAPRALVKTRAIQPRVEPLATRLDGLEDKAAKTRTELMLRRAEEIRAAAGSVRDTLYKNVAPLGEDHPELAAALHAHGVKRFQFILDKLPKDPGLAFNKLQSIWKPDPVAIEKFARYYEVFQNPVAVVNKIMATGRVYPEWSEGLREMDPALYTHVRVELLDRLSDPEVLAKLSYPEQVNMGMFLGIPLHSTMTPQFVATQQQMFMERVPQTPMPPQPGVGGGGGRPPGPANSSGATSAQRITEH